MTSRPPATRVVASLVDTSALIVLLRRSPPEGTHGVAVALAAELRARSAVLSSVTVAELVVGARDADAEARVLDLLERLPVVAADRAIAERAGRMGRRARARGATLPLPDLLIAATAQWLGVPLLTCDSDFGRGRDLAFGARPGDPWHGFELHPASVV
jgi:predicted nucleic acid-binding protein